VKERKEKSEKVRVQDERAMMENRKIASEAKKGRPL